MSGSDPETPNVVARPTIYEVFERGNDQPIDIGEIANPLERIGDVIVVGQQSYRVVNVQFSLVARADGPVEFTRGLRNSLRLDVESVNDDRADVAFHSSLWSWHHTEDLYRLLKGAKVSMAEEDNVVIKLGLNSGQHLYAKLIVTADLHTAFGPAQAYNSAILAFDSDTGRATYYKGPQAVPEDIPLGDATDFRGVLIAGQPLGADPREHYRRMLAISSPHPLFDLILLLLSNARVKLPVPSLVTVADTRRYHDELLKKLSMDFSNVYELTDRQWEQIVAELLERDGFDVHLTKKSRDGGIDIIASKFERFGKVVLGYECKRYRPDRPIGVGIIREFATALRNRKIGIGVLCATSRFTADAVYEAEMNLIYPQDAKAMQSWIQDLARRT